MMRKLTLFAALLCSISLCFGRTYTVEQVPNVQILDATRYTSNPDGILSQSAVEAIDRACDSLHSASRAQIAVVAIEDIEGDDVFQFAFDLFSAWGVGGKSSDNGLGILLVTEKREIRFVTGYGLEGVLTDAMCKRIQQRYMVSHLSAGDYSTGMVEGVAAVARIISGSEELSAQSDGSDEDFIIFILSFFGFVVLLIAIVSIAVWMSRKCPKCGKEQASTQIGRIHNVNDNIGAFLSDISARYAFLRGKGRHGVSTRQVDCQQRFVAAIIVFLDCMYFFLYGNACPVADLFVTARKSIEHCGLT